LPASLELTFTSLLIALVSAVPLGRARGLRPGSIIDHGVRCSARSASACRPSLGSAAIYVFYYLLGLAPDPTGRIDILRRCRHREQASC